MADVFLREDARKLLKGKKILFLGDSILRNIYQDMLWLLEHGTHTKADLLKKKGTQLESFCGDKLMPGTGTLDPGTKYWEVREFVGSDKLGGMTATYVFLTRCFSKRLEDFIYKKRDDPPDIVLVLSALWDINRWGPHGISDYKENCPKLLKLLTASYPQSTQVIWLTSPPIAVEIWGGFLLEGLEFQERSMRFNVMEANMMVANNAVAFGQDVVDLHYWMMHQIHKRMPDGIHWTSDAIRMQLNIILTHLCLSRDIPLPGRWGGDRNTPLESAQKFAKAADAGPVSFEPDTNWSAPTKRPWSQRMVEDDDSRQKCKRGRYDSPRGSTDSPNSSGNWGSGVY